MANRNKILANNSIDIHDIDPDDTDVHVVAWVDMRDFEQFAIAFFKTIGTGAIDTFRISASELAAGAGDTAVILTGTANPNAVGDIAYLEIGAEELAQAAVDNGFTNGLRFVTLEVEFATGTDEAVAAYILSSPRWAEDNLTVDVIS